MNEVYPKLYLAEFEDNCTAKICTAKELGTALAFKGVKGNTMIQVVSNNKKRTMDIEKKKLLPVLISMQKYLGRVNHAYFKSIPTLSPLYNTYDHYSLDFIDTMEFRIAVQLFSNINHIVRFHINMKLRYHHPKCLRRMILLQKIRKTMIIRCI